MLSIIAMCLVVSPFAPDLRSEALAEPGKVDREYWIADQKLYREYDGNTQHAFNWTVGVALSALNLAAGKPEWRQRLKTYAHSIESYWNDAPPVGGFDVLPGPKSMDRYYDDNAWMVMALADAGTLLKDKELLADARKALRHSLSGIDDKLGGGSYWKEAEKTSKNTCSNAPTAAACLALWKIEPKFELLKTAEDLYRWTFKNLRDPQDGLMWDAMSMDGKVEKTKWSYNTALMLRTAMDLSRATGNAEFTKDADAFAEASTKHWIDFSKGMVRCEAKFAHLLVENLAEYRRWKGLPLIDLQSLMEQILRRQSGSLPSRWDKSEPRSRPELIDQVSAIRAALSVAGSP